MTTLRRLTSTLLVSVLTLTGAASAQDRMLTLEDISTDLARLIGGSELDVVAAQEIEYGVTGKGDYDEFFRSSAIAYGGFIVGQALTNDATTNLKGYARSQAAVAELEAQIAEITEGADPEDWTTEQSLAVLQTANAQGQLSDEERAYMIATAANLAATIPVVESSIEHSARLTGQASGLVSGARSAFGMRRAGGMARNVTRSADRIKDVPTEGANLVEELLVLSRGLSMISGGG